VAARDVPLPFNAFFVMCQQVVGVSCQSLSVVIMHDCQVAPLLKHCRPPCQVVTILQRRGSPAIPPWQGKRAAGTLGERVTAEVLHGQSCQCRRLVPVETFTIPGQSSRQRLQAKALCQMRSRSSCMAQLSANEEQHLWQRKHCTASIWVLCVSQPG
jgi:hypothetical protein